MGECVPRTRACRLSGRLGTQTRPEGAQRDQPNLKQEPNVSIAITDPAPGDDLPLNYLLIIAFKRCTRFWLEINSDLQVLG